MRTESLKKAGQWVQFGLGLVMGVALAFIIYAGLQPRLEKTVRAQQALKDSAQKKDSLANAVTTAKARATLKSLPKEPKTTTIPVPSDTRQAAPKQSAVAQPQLTTLTSNGPAAGDLSHRPGLPVGFALVVMATALGAGTAAWLQARQEPQPPGAIASPVLEALFTLPTHRHMLQQELALSPRQTKRFSSKARMQHSQLRALLKPLNNSSPGTFSIDYQIKAFQLLLLLEASRRLPTPLPAYNAVAFISELQLAYNGHSSLAQARQEAFQHPVIIQAHSRETWVATPTAEVEARFMQQLYEMNAGLLA